CGPRALRQREGRHRVPPRGARRDPPAPLRLDSEEALRDEASHLVRRGPPLPRGRWHLRPDDPRGGPAGAARRARTPAERELGRLDEAEQRLASVREMRDDPRYLRALAALGAARGDLPGAEAWLRAPAADVAEERAVLRCLVAGTGEELAEARARGGEAWCRRTEEVMLAEEYFAALLGLRAFGDAPR